MMFKNFVKAGPKLSPVEPVSWWHPTPGPNAMVHGVYNPILRVGKSKPNEFMPAMPMPKKPRGTI